MDIETLNACLWVGGSLFGGESDRIWWQYVDGLKRSGLTRWKLSRAIGFAEARTGKECPQGLKEGVRAYRGRRVTAPPHIDKLIDQPYSKEASRAVDNWVDYCDREGVL